MHVYYKFGLFLIFLLSVSFCIPSASAQNSTQKSDYDDDDYYYDYSDYDDGNSRKNLTSTSTTLNNSTSKSINNNHTKSEDNVETIDADDEAYNYGKVPIQVPKRNHAYDDDQETCPTDCICLDEFQFIKCSYMELKQVPKTIPRTAIKVDLSHNFIEQINIKDFENYSNVREIILNHNRLANITTKEIFNGLTKLDHLSLANNLLTSLIPDVFSKATELSKLDLSNNTIVLPTNQPFLIQPDLRELLLRNTSITEIYEETFQNLSSLTLLKMDFNDFEKKINTKAFEPLKNLIKLKLPDLETDSIRELCNVLKSIDNIGLKRFDISCFELVLGTSFNESLILATDAPEVKPTQAVKPPTHGPHPSREISILSATTDSVLITKLTTRRMKATTMEAANPLGESGANWNQSSLDERTVIGGAGADATEQTYQVAISREVINYLLISIIVLASIGILIGIVCRKDIAGVKTKCCRTRRPLPTDQVRPAEEIPLNKVV